MIDDGITDNSAALRKLVEGRSACRKANSVSNDYIGLVDDHVIAEPVAAPASWLANREHHGLTVLTSIRRFWARIKGAGG